MIESCVNLGGFSVSQHLVVKGPNAENAQIRLLSLEILGLYQQLWKCTLDFNLTLAIPFKRNDIKYNFRGKL